MKTINIDKSFRGGSKSTTFSGRKEGQEARKRMQLDELDNNNEPIVITIPEDTTSFNPSFFLGLFYPSVEKLKSVDAFKKKYILSLENLPEELKRYIQEDYDDCYNRCENELNNRTGKIYDRRSSLAN